MHLQCVALKGCVLASGCFWWKQAPEVTMQPGLSRHPYSKDRY